jgi:hypothetical protein
MIGFCRMKNAKRLIHIQPEILRFFRCTDPVLPPPGTFQNSLSGEVMAFPGVEAVTPYCAHLLICHVFDGRI